MIDGSSLLLLLVSDNDMVSPVGPFLFFFGNRTLTTFDAFRFRVAMTFVERFVDPSDLREAGMMPVLNFFFCHVCNYTRNSATVQFVKFAEFGLVVIGTFILIS
jgi:hypothetical protein